MVPIDWVNKIYNDVARYPGWFNNWPGENKVELTVNSGSSVNAIVELSNPTLCWISPSFNGLCERNTNVNIINKIFLKSNPFRSFGL